MTFRFSCGRLLPHHEAPTIDLVDFLLWPDERSRIPAPDISISLVIRGDSASSQKSHRVTKEFQTPDSNGQCDLFSGTSVFEAWMVYDFPIHMNSTGTNGSDHLDPDEDLLQEARRAPEGDLRAFEQLVERHHRRIVANCRYITRDPNNAEDLAQEVLTRHFSASIDLRGGRHFDTGSRRSRSTTA